MSSKRKNTPTKLAKDDGRHQHMENGSDGASSHGDSDMESDSSLSLHIVTSKPETMDDMNDGADSPGSDRPQTKKQRLLQSVKCDGSDSEPDMITYHNNNNTILTKPTSGLQRKSMDNVLRRLSTKANSENHLHHHQHHHGVMNNNHNSNSHHSDQTDVSDDMELLDSVKTVINSAADVDEKEKRLTEMIAQLQNLKESLGHKKGSSGGSNNSHGIHHQKEHVSTIIS